MKQWRTMAATGTIVVLSVIAGTILYLQLSKRTLVVSTTTSLYDTDLLREIERRFEAKYPVDVQFISAGTGIAIEHARNGDADIILVHSPSQEKLFLEEGYVVSRKIFAYNFFTIVGPQDDPARINGLGLVEALSKIAEYGRNQTADPNLKIWYSRADSSGTHSKEQSLWKLAGFNYTTLSAEFWYANGGGKMGETLLKAEEKSAYTLSDIGTYLKYKEKDQIISLETYLQESYDLLNVYAALPVNQTRHKHVNSADAVTFLKYLLSDEGQQQIENFRRDDFGQSGMLFHAAVQLLAHNSTQEMAQWIRNYAFIESYECPPRYQDPHYPELYSQP